MSLKSSSALQKDAKHMTALTVIDVGEREKKSVCMRVRVLLMLKIYIKLQHCDCLL